MNILIVGGGGLIGSGLTTYFLNNGHNVTVVDNYTSSLHTQTDKRAKIITGSAVSFPVLNNIFSSFKPDVVFHLADNVVDKDGIYSFTDESDTYVCILNNLLRCIDRYGIFHLFLGSTSEVYSGKNKVVNESTDTGIFSYTGAVKHYSEQVVRFFASNKKINYTFLRYFQIYGNRRFINPKFDIVSYLLDTITRKQGVFIIGPKIQVDVLNVVDAVSATAAVFDGVLNGTKIECVNIGSGEGITMLDLYGKLSSAANEKNLPVYKLKPREQTRSLIADTSLLESLGWNKTTNLDTDLTSLVEFRRGLSNVRNR